MTDAILAGAVLAAMTGLAVHDARSALVDPRLVLALLGAAAAWRFGGSAGTEGAWPRLAAGVLGASLGVAAAMVPIGVAAWLGRRWPLYPGDAMLLGALGFLLGVPGLAWAMLLGSALALLHRFCVQRRRGRPFRKGLVPLGPGMCAGAAAVFLCMNFGVALAGEAQDSVVAPLPAVPAASEPAPLPATELGPALGSLPATLAARDVAFDTGESLAFPSLVNRIAALAGVAMRIEERPARIAGGEAALPEPPALSVAWEGPLAGLLDRVSRLSGYDWSWETLGSKTLVPGTLVPETLGPETLGPETSGPEDGAVVFHRYWDTAQRAPAQGAGPVAGHGQSGGAPRDGGWTVDPEEHRTLRGVLESWAARAGWTLVWNAERDYGLGAAAVFEGGFLEAADLLLSGPATRRTLEVRAYAANRHLVVADADGAGW